MFLKMTGINNIAIFAFILTSLIINNKMAFSTPTKWERVNESLEQLLNNGWQIIGHSTNRAATSTSPGVTGYDQTSFSYLLSNKGKYITCYILEPKPPIALTASCRKLN